MMNYKEMMEKERTIKGYDLVKAFDIADSYCDHYRVSGRKRDRVMLEIIAESLMEDDLYEKLHKSASESYEKTTTVAETLDKLNKALGKLVRSVILAEKEEE